MFKNTGWIVPGILLAGTLLLIGAITEGNASLVIVTFLVMAVAIGSAARSSDDDKRRRSERRR